jgi:hypothetical protein
MTSLGVKRSLPGQNGQAVRFSAVGADREKSLGLAAREPAMMVQ